MSLVRARENMKYLQILVWAFVVVFVLGAVAMYNTGSTPAPAGSGAAEFARINGDPVSNAQFDATMRQVERQYEQFAQFGGQPVSLEQRMQFPEIAWQQIVGEYAQAEAAEANGVSVSSSEARAQIEQQIDQILAQRGEGATEEELRQARAAMLEMASTDSARRGLMAERLQSRLEQQVRPVEIRVAHILLTTEKRTEDQARNLAREISRRARGGIDFAQLVSQYSEDDASKGSGGDTGWVSAVPAPPDQAKQKGPDATHWGPEFISAALRLRPGEVSEPVQTQRGVHVLKALEERPYTPTGEEAKDQKKRDEAIQSYRQAAARQAAQGLFAEYQRSLEIDAKSPWLQGYLAETNIGSATEPTKQQREQAMQLYAQALEKNDPAGGPPLAYKLAQMYQLAEQHDKAVALLEKYSRNSGYPQLYQALGQNLEKLNKKTEAVKAYQDAMKAAYNHPEILEQLAARFKELGRNDLAQQAQKSRVEQLARREAQQKAQQEAMLKAQAEQKAAEAAAKKTSTFSTQGNAPAGNAPTGNAPAANTPAGNAPAAP
ncbi:MAG: peptidylprolyl isomerase [Armatimonadota bacterium]